MNIGYLAIIYLLFSTKTGRQILGILFVFVFIAIFGWWSILIALSFLSVLFLLNYSANNNSKEQKRLNKDSIKKPINDYKKRIIVRNQSIANVMRNDPDVTVRKGDEASGVLPKAYKFFIYEGLTNTKTSRFQDDMINIIFRVSEDFRGIVIEIKNLSRDKFYIKWGSATISDNHVYIDDILYKDYMSLGKLRPGESVTKTLREKSLSNIFFDEDILRQNCKLTNNAGYVVRIPITLESGKKIRYKFSIVTGRVDEE